MGFTTGSPEQDEGEGRDGDAPPAREGEASDGEASASGGGEQEDGAEQRRPSSGVAGRWRKRKRAVVCSDDGESQEVDAHGFSVQDTEAAMRHSFADQSSPGGADKSAGPSSAAGEPDAEEEEATDDEEGRHAIERRVARRAVRIVLGFAHQLAFVVLRDDGTPRRADRRYELVKDVARHLETMLLPDEVSEID